MKEAKKLVNLVMNTWWLRHLLFWIFILNYFTWGFGIGDTGDDIGDMKSQYIRIAMYIPGFMVVVYTLLYFLIPHFLVKKNYILFFAGFMSLIGFAIIYVEIFQLNFHSTSKFYGFDFRWGRNVLPFIHVTGIATAIKFIKYSYFHEDRTQKAVQQKTLAELELLKAQIHPHFLFNTLNNLFAHTLQNSPDSPQIVARLSDLLRFMIYESRQDFISILKEVELLKNYIELEKLRYGQELELSATFTGDLENKLIRPLLLLPLIENSFKHGLSQQLEQKWIVLDLHVEKNILYFKLANSKDPKPVDNKIKGKSKGIGLENVKRRLELLYPGMYKMEIIDQLDIFRVDIEIHIMDEILVSANSNLTSSFSNAHILDKSELNF